VIYFVQAEGGGPIKIGRTIDLRKRMASFQCVSPVPLRVLAVMPGGPLAEFELHGRFAAHRTYGEWFNPSPVLVTYIERYGVQWDGSADQFAETTAPVSLVELDFTDEEPAENADRYYATLNEYIESGKALDSATEECRRNASWIFREIRREMKLTQRGLAALLGISHTYLSKVENDHELPGHPVLVKLYEVVTKHESKKL
jgi:DNA-binding transcriptional regulator YiaG